MNLRYIPLAEVVVPGKRLGRHVVQDQRSHNFGADRASSIISVNHRSIGLPLDQDVPTPLGSCTGNALVAALNSDPNVQPGDAARTESDALRLYQAECDMQGQPCPPNDPGGSGLMVCKAAQAAGLIRSYQHAFGATEALEALVVRPIIIGIPWYSGMDQTDEHGLVTVSGHVRGGHELCADEIIAEQNLVGLWQSWGASYGLGGKFYMSFDTLDRLLSEQGDATVPLV